MLTLSFPGTSHRMEERQILIYYWRQQLKGRPNNWYNFWHQLILFWAIPLGDPRRQVAKEKIKPLESATFSHQKEPKPVYNVFRTTQWEVPRLHFASKIKSSAFRLLKRHAPPKNPCVTVFLAQESSLVFIGTQGLVGWGHIGLLGAGRGSQTSSLPPLKISSCLTNYEMFWIVVIPLLPDSDPITKLITSLSHIWLRPSIVCNN
jgi:hypothetical protein